MRHLGLIEDYSYEQEYARRVLSPAETLLSESDFTFESNYAD
jgi:hypothetical protein